MSIVLPVKNLPSKGIKYDFEVLELSPLTYSMIKKYSAFETRDNLVKKYYRDITHLIKRLPKWESLLLCDLDALIFAIKYITIQEDKSVDLPITCSNCNVEFSSNFDINKIDFEQLNEDFTEFKNIKLGDKKYPINHYATVGEFFKVVNNVMHNSADLSRYELYLLTFLDYNNNLDLYNVIQGATHEEITALNTLYEKDSCESKPVTLKCSSCGKEVVVRLNNLITDLFRCIYINTYVRSELLFDK